MIQSWTLPNFQGNFQVFQFQNARNNRGTQEAPKVLEMHPLHPISLLHLNMFKLFHCQLAFFAEEFALSNRRWNKHRHVWASSNAAGAHPKIWWNIHDAPSRLCHVERTLIGETGDGTGDGHTNVKPWSLEVITDNALKKWGKSRWKTRPPGATNESQN